MKVVKHSQNCGFIFCLQKMNGEQKSYQETEVVEGDNSLQYLAYYWMMKNDCTSQLACTLLIKNDCACQLVCTLMKNDCTCHLA